MLDSLSRTQTKSPVTFLLGHRGMLGSTVYRYLLECGHSVLTTDTRYYGDPSDALLREVVDSSAQAIVNCLGVIPASGASDREMMAANALLPVHLSSVLGGRLLIHASTDCVFDGRLGWRSVNDSPNATDAYGLSKRVGETCVAEPNVVVLRTSIVGPPAAAGRGLLGWFLRQEGSVEGWTDHRWNGITALAWAELAAKTVEGRGVGPGLHQPTTAVEVTKDGLLRIFAEVFDHRIDIRPVTAAQACDRTLIPTVEMPPLPQQLTALRAWMERLSPDFTDVPALS
jgi:dTDP-4-dehydrorhamnose reductase